MSDDTDQIFFLPLWVLVNSERLFGQLWSPFIFLIIFYIKIYISIFISWCTFLRALGVEKFSRSSQLRGVINCFARAKASWTKSQKDNKGTSRSCNTTLKVHCKLFWTCVLSRGQSTRAHFHCLKCLYWPRPESPSHLSKVNCSCK